MNILILTKTYPSPDDLEIDGTTPVVRDFAVYWAAAGHTVYVYHNYIKKPKLLNALPVGVIQTLNSKFGYSLTPSMVNSSKNGKSIRVEDGVRVSRFPLLKLVPGRGLADIQVRKQFEKIKNDMADEGFIPDIIFGHWEDPQLQLLSMFKSVFNVPCVFTCHKIAYLNRARYLKKSQRWFRNIDVLFARNEAIGEQLQHLLGLSGSLPVCRSGISSAFLEKPVPKGVQRKGVLYIGRLLPYKNVDVLIKACQNHELSSLRGLRVVGNGPEEIALRKIGTTDVEFLGKQNHNFIIDELDRASVMSMVSTGETFGLSYIEAMARGCIVIAGDDGGMCGVIKNGVNGFLCKPGSVEELSSLLLMIESLSSERVEQIRANAIKTAAHYTQTECARSYLNTALAIAASLERGN